MSSEERQPSQPGGADASSEKPGRRALRGLPLVLVALIGAFMSILDSSIVNVAIPSIMKVFGVSASEVQWVATVYMLALGVVVPLAGWLGDRLGFKRLYMISLGVFAGGFLLLCTMAWSLNALIVARAIQAMGGGMIMPTTMAMVFRMVPRDKIGSGMGIFGISLWRLPPSARRSGGYLVEYVNCAEFHHQPSDCRHWNPACLVCASGVSVQAPRQARHLGRSHVGLGTLLPSPCSQQGHRLGVGQRSDCHASRRELLSPRPLCRY